MHRRSLYTFVKRNATHPGMKIFDFPDRNESIARRRSSNTPLQALRADERPAVRRGVSRRSPRRRLQASADEDAQLDAPVSAGHARDAERPSSSPCCATTTREQRAAYAGDDAKIASAARRRRRAGRRGARSRGAGGADQRRRARHELARRVFDSLRMAMKKPRLLSFDQLAPRLPAERPAAASARCRSPSCSAATRRPNRRHRSDERRRPRRRPAFRRAPSA